jgi:hypothetical protein
MSTSLELLQGNKVNISIGVVGLIPISAAGIFFNVTLAERFVSINVFLNLCGPQPNDFEELFGSDWFRLV